MMPMIKPVKENQKLSRFRYSPCQCPSYKRKKITYADKFDFVKEKVSMGGGGGWTCLWKAVTTERSHRKNTVAPEVPF